MNVPKALRIFSRTRALLLCSALAIFTASCGAPPPPPAPHVVEPAWADVIDGNEALVAVIRPKALAHDPVYGALVRSAFAAALAKGGGASLDIFNGVEELVLVFPERKSDASMIVLSGVDADRSPEKMTDERGQTIFTHGADARGGLSEYVDARGRNASLFTLPRRTWVIASGSLRETARQAFGHPAGRPVPSYGDDHALAIARFDGRALVAELPGLRQGGLAAVGKNLAIVQLTLLPENKGLNVSLHYANDDQAGVSAVFLEQARTELAQQPKLAWLAKATVAREGNRDVQVHLDIPKDLVLQLQHAQPQDLINL